MARSGLAALLVVGLTLAALAAPAQAAVPPYTILTQGGFIVRLGPMNLRRDPSPAAARNAFGQPSSITPIRGACRIDWSRLKLRTTFTSFGLVSDFCREGALQAAVIRSPIWRTWAGLRVGMRSSRIPELHRRARFVDGKWVLATQSVYGPEPSPTVSALVSRGKVIALSLWIGGAGD